MTQCLCLNKKGTRCHNHVTQGQDPRFCRVHQSCQRSYVEPTIVTQPVHPVSRPTEFSSEQPAKEIKAQRVTYFFQPTTGVDLRRIRMTDISLYSVTPWREANLISNRIINFYRDHGHRDPSTITVTDATANVGGNTISFYLSGIGRVNAVELDSLTCGLLINNLSVYGLPTNTVYCGDYLSLSQELQQDCVFFDPPWGGPEYKQVKRLDLYLGSVNVIDLCRQLLNQQRASLVVYKIPLNYNLEGLRQQLNGHQLDVLKIFRGQKHSYNVVLCY